MRRAGDDCVMGKFQEQDSTASVNCKFCAAGKESASTTAAVCNDCTSGQYQDQNQVDEPCSAPDFCIVTCSACEKGKASESSEEQCEVCATGKYQDQAASTSYGCKSCNAGTGFVSDKEECEVCDGKYQNQNDCGEQCKFCPKGQYFVDRFNACVVCIVGRYQKSEASKNAVCIDCPAGFYQHDIGQDSCVSLLF